MANIEATNVNSDSVEFFKAIRTNVGFLLNEQDNVVMFSSSAKGDGKSFIVSNLAASFTELGKKVLIIDTDLRRGVQHQNFEILNSNGLSDLLEKKDIKNLTKYIKKTNINNLYLIPRGKIVNNVPELLMNGTLKEVIDLLKKQFDYIFVDVPPVNIVTDVTILSRYVSNVILVASIGKTKIKLLEESKKVLTRNNCNILGVIANRVPIHKHSYKYQGYEYDYSEKKKTRRRRK